MKVRVSIFNRDNYHTTIEIPNYKQIGRVVSSLRKYLKQQDDADFRNMSIRYYIFEIKPCKTLPSGMYMTEEDLWVKG